MKPAVVRQLGWAIGLGAFVPLGPEPPLFHVEHCRITSKPILPALQKSLQQGDGPFHVKQLHEIHRLWSKLLD